MSTKSNLPISRPAGLLAVLGDQTGRQAAAINRAAFIERTRRAAERDLALLEIGDVEALAARGIVAAGNTAGHAMAEMEANPYAAEGVTRLLKTTNGGLDQVLRRFIEG
jgi:hypothetical protein